MERQEALRQEEEDQFDQQLLDFNPEPKKQYKPEEQSKEESDDDFLDVEDLDQFLEDGDIQNSQDAVNFNKTMDE